MYLPVDEVGGGRTITRYVAISLILSSLVLVVLDGAIANVALPSIAQSMHADAGRTVWVVSAYQLAVLLAILPCGTLGEIYGARRVFLIGIALFTAASAACALANTLLVLVLARFAQGLGGGAIMALAMMNMRAVVPERSLGPIIGINAMVVAISSAAGPGIAGAILSVTQWPWLFAINLPLGVVVLLGGRLLGKMERSERALNVMALVLNTSMFILFFCGTEQIASAPIIGISLLAAAGALLFGLVRLERSSHTPIIPTDLLAQPAFRTAVIASVCCFCGQMLSYIALPFYLQDTYEMSPVSAGLYMMPWPIATAMVAPIAGKLANRLKTAWLCSGGAALLAFGLLIIVLAPTDSHATAFLTGSIIAGFGFGLFQTPNNRILLLSAPRARSGAAGAMQGTARLMGQTLGGIIMSVVFAGFPLSTALAIAVFVASGFAVMASLASIGRSRHEATDRLSQEQVSIEVFNEG